MAGVIKGRDKVVAMSAASFGKIVIAGQFETDTADAGQERSG